MIYSHSQKAVAQECLKKYKHQYVNKVYPKKTPTFFVIGRAVHKFMHVYYQTRGQQLEAAVGLAMAEFDRVDTKLLSEEQRHDLEVDRAMVLGICAAYPQKYPDDFERFVDFMVEQKASVLLWSVDLKDEKTIRSERIEYEGTMDLLAKDKDGAWWIIDTKTARDISDDYFRRVHIDDQLASYCELAYKVLKIKPKGVIYNAIKKPGIRLKMNESHAQYAQRVHDEYVVHGDTKQMMQRCEVIIGDRQVKRWRENTIDVLRDLTIRRLTPGAKWPMNTGACIGKYGSCAYLEACIAGKYNHMQYTKERT